MKSQSLFSDVFYHLLQILFVNLRVKVISLSLSCKYYPVLTEILSVGQ